MVKIERKNALKRRRKALAFSLQILKSKK